MTIQVNTYLNLPSTSTLLISNMETSSQDDLLNSSFKLITIAKKHKKTSKYTNDDNTSKCKKRKQMLSNFIESNWLDYRKDTTTDDECNKTTTTPPKFNSSFVHQHSKKIKKRNEMTGLANEFQKQTKSKRSRTEESNTTLDSETEYLISKYLVMSSSNKEKREKKIRRKQTKRKYKTPPKNESNKNTCNKNSVKLTKVKHSSGCDLIEKQKNTLSGTKSNESSDDKQTNCEPTLESSEINKSDSNKDLHTKTKHKKSNTIDKYLMRLEKPKKSPKVAGSVAEFDPETIKLLSVMEGNTETVKIAGNIAEKSPQKEKRVNSKMRQLSLMLKQTIKDTTKISSIGEEHRKEKFNGEKNGGAKKHKKHKQTLLTGSKDEKSIPHTDESLISIEPFLEQTLEEREASTSIITEASNEKVTREGDENCNISKLLQIQSGLGLVDDQFDVSYSDIEEMLGCQLELDEENALKCTQKLMQLQIMLPFRVPQSHKIETRFTAPMTKEQNKQVKELGIKYKTGSYTKNEDETIKDNFKEFCKLHDLEHNAEPFLVIRNLLPVERANFVRFLGRNLENRQLYSIYKRFKTLFTEIQKGKFTPHENAVIIMFMKKNKHRKDCFVKLAKLLRRDPLAVCKHYSTLKKMKVDHNKYVLDENQLEEFLKNIQEVTHSMSIENLKDKAITKDEWDEISKRLEMPAAILKNTWYRTVHPRIFVKKSYGKIAKGVLSRLYEMNVRDWREVQWNEIAKHYDGCNPIFLFRLIYKLMGRFIKKEHHGDARKCIKHLMKVEENDLAPKEPPQRIIWKDGSLSYYTIL